MEEGGLRKSGMTLTVWVARTRNGQNGRAQRWRGSRGGRSGVGEKRSRGREEEQPSGISKCVGGPPNGEPGAEITHHPESGQAHYCGLH